MKKFVLFVFSLLSIAVLPVSAQIPISGTIWSGSDITSSVDTDPSTFTTLPATVFPGATAVNISQWNRFNLTATATTSPTTGLCYNSSNWELGGSFSTAQANGKYIYFTVTNSATSELEITNVTVVARTSSTGPHFVAMTYAIGTGADQTFGDSTATNLTLTPPATENLLFNGTAHICPGQTATFKLYGWGATGAAGTFRITDGTGVTANYVTGPPTATASNSAEIFPVCEGGMINFTGAAVGGLVPYTYSWTGPASYSAAGATPIIDPAAASADGVYTLIVTDAYGCMDTTTTTAQVTPGPDTTMTISGPLSFCTPNSVTFTVPLDFSYDYTWFDAVTGSFVDFGVNSYTAFSSGQYYVEIDDLLTGCTALSTIYTVTATTTPSPFINVSGPTSVCLPATVSLSSTDVDPAYTYQWSNASGSISGATNSTYSPTTSGTYSITVVNGTCSGVSPGVTITINTPPTTPVVTPTGPITTCSGSPLTLTSTTQPGVNYRWWRGATSIPGATNSTYGALISGTYSMVVTDPATGCTATSNGVVLTINPLPVSTITANPGTTICSGSSVTLSTVSVPGYTYQWLSGNLPIAGATNATYNTTSAGTYRVIVTNPTTGCFDTTTAPGTTLTVQPSPSASDAVISPAGPFTICSFDSVVLSTPGTTPGLSYQWLNPATISGATNSSYTARTTGTYRVRITNGFGCSATSSTGVSITVNPAPASAVSLSGPTTFCEGSNLVISAATGAGYTYQWYNASGPISGETGSTYTATTSGTYHVVITAPNTCQTTSVSTTVTVVPTPTILVSGSPSFCAGNSVLLTVSTIGIPGVTYQWKRNGTNIPGAVSATYAANVTGDYTCFVNIPGSCAVLTGAVTVNVFPTVFPAITFDGTYVSTHNFYASYQWYINTVTIPGATNYRYAAYTNASYRVLVTDTNGCQILSDEYEIFNLGVDNANAGYVIGIYPNPATSTVHVTAPIEVKVSITTLDGKTVMTAAKGDINISSLANGLYMILVYDEKGNRLHVEKLVKQ